MSRWKCPDCKGWVSSAVLVHFCELKTVPDTNWPHRPPYRPLSGTDTAPPFRDYNISTPSYDTHSAVIT